MGGGRWAVRWRGRGERVAPIWQGGDACDTWHAHAVQTPCTWHVHAVHTPCACHVHAHARTLRFIVAGGGLLPPLLGAVAGRGCGALLRPKTIAAVRT